MPNLIKSSLAYFKNSFLEHTLIYIGVNRIGNQGCKFLSQGEWRQIENIYICVLLVIQKITESAIKVVPTCPKRSGNN